MPDIGLFRSKRRLGKAAAAQGGQLVASADEDRTKLDAQSSSAAGRRDTGRRKPRHERNESSISGIKDLAENQALNERFLARNPDGTTGWGLSRKPNKFIRRSMDKIRRSLRQSLGRARGRDGDSVLGTGRRDSKDLPAAPSLQQDEQSVRNNTCAFNVKYLGCVEVYESRGMIVCEEALKALRNQRRKPVKAILYVSGDGLRVVDAESNRGLLVDQTIEKVSFCAPDRTNVKGFAYICRDGTTRRWMCHGFAAIKESGERLSHAVGCAFSVCLENKQKLDRDAQVAAPSSPAAQSAAPAAAAASSVNGQFARANVGSFRQATLLERKIDPQSAIIVEKDEQDSRSKTPQMDMSAARARPSSHNELFNRQSSLRMPQPAPAATQNFKRNYSMRAEQPAIQPTIQVNQSAVYQMPSPSQNSSAHTTPRNTAKSGSTIDEILDIFNNTELPSESARSYQPLPQQPSTSNWATSTPKKGHATVATPLWDQTFEEEEEEDKAKERVDYVSPCHLPASNTTDSFFGELDRQQQVDASPFRRAAPSSHAPPLSPSHDSDDGQHSQASSSQRTKAEEWLQSTLRASLRGTPPNLVQSPPHTPFTPPPVPPRKLPNTFSTDFNAPQQHWQQFSPDKKTSTNVFQPQVDPFEEKWIAFSKQQDNPFQHESAQVNI